MLGRHLDNKEKKRKKFLKNKKKKKLNKFKKEKKNSHIQGLLLKCCQGSVEETDGPPNLGLNDISVMVCFNFNYAEDLLTVIGYRAFNSIKARYFS